MQIHGISDQHCVCRACIMSSCVPLLHALLKLCWLVPPKIMVGMGSPIEQKACGAIVAAPVGIERVDCHALAISWIPPDAGLYAALWVPRASKHNGLIHPPHLQICTIPFSRTLVCNFQHPCTSRLHGHRLALIAAKPRACITNVWCFWHSLY